MSTERMITAGVDIAVREYGGDGPPVLLLHGGGGNLLNWATFAPALTEAHRVVAVDLRGHGRSGDGAWQWDAVLDDLDAVADALELTGPLVVGASLGGATAVRWARRHHHIPAIVNLDGHGHPSGYPGAPAEDIVAAQAQLDAVFTAQAEAMAAPITAEQAEAMVAQQRQLAATVGADPDLFEAAFRRNLLADNDKLWLRPSGAALLGVRAAIERERTLDLYAGLACPALLVVANQPLPGQEAFDQLLTATQRGVLADLTGLATHQPNLRVVDFDGSHGMMFEQPDRLAAMILDFLAASQIR